MDDHSVELDEETEFYCTLLMFTNVTNTAEIREKLIAGKLQCCIVKVALVTDAFQVIVAANKAALNAKRNQLITKNIYTEVLFTMSMSKNISRSLIEFGISDSDKDILVLLIYKLDEKEAVMKEILKSIKGEKVSISRLQEFTDANLVKKTYKINDEELQNSSLLDAVVSKISCKEFISSKN
ncbi:PREDICTED: EKC/KEOPS complex subunit TPRKB-like [Cyphomyrmex costatus]|uniref:TP53RK-binding protein n=1 Tax=Cyphomyrmex costatus TaxID=456900 RepID=A0A195CYQ7_9HYME|nr:PREDICTED: EKC/KEOPS complex subunit TPRKB-like [Cyphomyrmex costatus]KYN05707.1 TP53RK-binding protein [Cyphomyrmex costatus]